MRRAFSKKETNRWESNDSTVARLAGLKMVRSASFAAVASSRGHTLVDRELYLPKSWTDDQERGLEAHVPKEVTFATKPELARRMLERALDADLPVAWVVGDTAYGGSPPLRIPLETPKHPYPPAVPFHNYR